MIAFILSLFLVGVARPATPPPVSDSDAAVEFIVLGSAEDAAGLLDEALRTLDCLTVLRSRDSTGVPVLAFSDPCPGESNRAVLRLVDGGDGTTRGLVRATFSSASAIRSLALLPVEALNRREVPVYIVPITGAGHPPCVTFEEWRATLETPPSAPTAEVGGDYEEVTPVLVGGIGRFVQSVQYPNAALIKQIEGRTVARFVVGETGAVSCAELTVSLGPDLDAEALRAVRAARFSPGTQNGRPVPVRMSLPVVFRIQ